MLAKQTRVNYLVRKQLVENFINLILHSEIELNINSLYHNIDIYRSHNKIKKNVEWVYLVEALGLKKQVGEKREMNEWVKWETRNGTCAIIFKSDV